MADAPEGPTNPPRRRVRIIGSSASPDESIQSGDGISDREAALLIRGKPAYFVSDIRGERMKRGKTKYHVLWEGYNSPGATEQASNVNQQEMDAWLDQKGRNKNSLPASLSASFHRIEEI